MKSIRIHLFIFPPIVAVPLYLAALGQMIPAIREQFSLSLAQAGLFSTLQSVGMMGSLLLCFCVFSACNRARIVTIASFTLAASFLVLGMNNVMIIMYFLFFIVGLVINLIETLSSAMIAEISEEKSGFYLGIQYTLRSAFGIIGPFMVAAFANDYSKSFYTLAIVFVLASIVFFYGMKSSVKQPFVQNCSQIGMIKKLFRVFRKQGMALYFTLAFFCIFVQSPIIFFLSSYAGNIRGLATDGAVAVAIFYFGLLVGRMVYAKISHNYSGFKIMIFSNSLAIIAFAAMLFTTSFISVWIFAFIGGVFIAASTPTILVGACKAVPNDTVAATSVVFFGTILASLIAPPLVGAIGDITSLRFGMLVSTSMLIIVIALAAVIYKKMDMQSGSKTQ